MNEAPLSLLPLVRATLLVTGGGVGLRPPGQGNRKEREVGGLKNEMYGLW